MTAVAAAFTGRPAGASAPANRYEAEEACRFPASANHNAFAQTHGTIGLPVRSEPAAETGTGAHISLKSGSYSGS